MAFGASVLCWYEHISRVVSLLLCKNHRRWESAFKFVTRNRSEYAYFVAGIYSFVWHLVSHYHHNDNFQK